jgi:hypothetical protein
MLILKQNLTSQYNTNVYNTIPTIFLILLQGMLKLAARLLNAGIHVPTVAFPIHHPASLMEIPE